MGAATPPALAGAVLLQLLPAQVVVEQRMLAAGAGRGENEMCILIVLLFKVESIAVLLREALNVCGQ